MGQKKKDVPDMDPAIFKQPAVIVSKFMGFPEIKETITSGREIPFFPEAPEGKEEDEVEGQETKEPLGIPGT
jgi:hypothetical protein